VEKYLPFYYEIFYHFSEYLFPKKAEKYLRLYIVFYHFEEYLFPKGLAVFLDVEKLFPK